LELNASPPPWPRFVQLVNKRFKPPLTESPIGELALLYSDGSIDDFAKKFMALSYRDTAITKAHKVQCSSPVSANLFGRTMCVLSK
jgi:hypothetical protein